MFKYSDMITFLVAYLAYVLFFRYGSPGQVQVNYSEFAENYMTHFAIPILNTCLQVLDGYRNGSYVSSRVLHSLLQYIDIAISQSRTWKVIKPHFQVLWI